jgi:hypothetical protein
MPASCNMVGRKKWGRAKSRDGIQRKWEPTDFVVPRHGWLSHVTSLMFSRIG